MTYSATKKIFFCTEFDISDGSFKRVAKWKTVIYPQTNEGIIVVPRSLEGRCQYKQIAESYIRVTIPGRADAYNTVYITDGVLDLGVQTIRCKEIQIPVRQNQKRYRNRGVTVKAIAPGNGGTKREGEMKQWGGGGQ